MRVAVALRLGCSVYVAHTCRCGALVDAQGIHGSVCKQAPSKIARHQAINDVIALAITAAGVVPVTKEPVDLTRLDSDVTMTKVIARVYPVLLMNVDGAPGGRQPQTKPVNLGCESAENYYYYYYYYAAFNAPCVGHKDDESSCLCEIILVRLIETARGRRMSSE